MSEQVFHGGQGVADGAARLTAHARECEECRVSPLPLSRMAVLLDSAPADIDAAGMSARVVLRLRGELQAVRGMSWRRVLVQLLRALLPLPAVLAVDACVLGAAYWLGSAVLPSAVVAYVVLSGAAFLVFVFGLTYAVVPLLMARQAAGVSPSVWVRER